MKTVTDEELRAWRDFLESRISRELNLNVDLQIADKTRFHFLGGSETHSVVEIESFARKALDAYLHKRASV